MDSEFCPANVSSIINIKKLFCPAPPFKEVVGAKALKVLNVVARYGVPMFIAVISFPMMWHHAEKDPLYLRKIKSIGYTVFTTLAAGIIFHLATSDFIS